MRWNHWCAAQMQCSWTVRIAGVIFFFAFFFFFVVVFVFFFFAPSLAAPSSAPPPSRLTGPFSDLFGELFFF